MADPKVKLYDWTGKELGSEKLDPAVFAVAVKPTVVHDMVVAQQANSRQVLAHTKGRSDVRGGGKKPWRQKGTGRARHGSIRSPLWIGGGVTFGPTSKRNFSVKVNKKNKTKALMMVLSDKVAESKLILMDTYNLSEAKTKLLQKTLNALPSKDKSVLIITKKSDGNIMRAASNLPKTKIISYSSLNIVDLLSSEYVIVSKDLVSKIKEHYL